MTEVDVIGYVEDQLEHARGEAARWIDRAEALGELAGHARAVAGDLDQPFLFPDQMWAAASSEEDRARLQALVERALDNPEPEGGHTR